MHVNPLTIRFTRTRDSSTYTADLSAHGVLVLILPFVFLIVWGQICQIMNHTVQTSFI
jgi:hypothetical protein